MDDLAQFLRDRLDEDEQTARAATGTEWGDVDPQQPYVIWDVRARQKNRTLTDTGRLAAAESGEDRAHIARHDPARVLREVEAKRRLIGFLRPNEVYRWSLRLLALPYADHPDYQDAWRP